METIEELMESPAYRSMMYNAARTKAAVMKNVFFCDLELQIYGSPQPDVNIGSPAPWDRKY